jgi:hypothetical protein
MTKFNCGTCKHYVEIDKDNGKCVRFPPVSSFHHGWYIKNGCNEYHKSYYKPLWCYPEIQRLNCSCGEWKDKRPLWKILIAKYN